MSCRSLVACLLVLTALGLAPARGGAQTVLWNESTNGDLSNNQAAPTPFTLAAGVSSIIGSVTGGSDTQDWVTLTVPSGLRLSSLVLASYQSTDAQGFTGVQAGTAFVGSVNNPASYLGYAHFGTGATNGSLPATNLVGADLLPIMGDTMIATGAQGFTPPLGEGSYTFLIQQLGANTAYRFDYTVTPVPEPSSVLVVAALAGAACLARSRASRGRRPVGGD
jgi:hypothetical protein